MNRAVAAPARLESLIGPHQLQRLVHELLSQAPEAPAKSLDWQEEYAYTLGLQAYVYGFPWVYLAQLRWLWSTPGGKAVVEELGLELPYAPINHFFHAPELATPANQTGGAPNTDTLYSTAWLDLSEGPIVLGVPAVTDRYYCVQMASIDSDNFAYVGVRATGTAAGKYLIAGPGWTGKVPRDVLDILPRSRTPTALLFGRTGVNNHSQEELRKARQVQRQYELIPLSTYPRKPRRHPTHALIPIGIDIQDPLGTWVSMNRAMTQNPPGVPPGIDQSELLALFATIGVGPDQDLAAQSRATRTGLQRAAQQGYPLLHEMTKGRGKMVNGWSYPPRDIGQAGQNQDFITRAALQALAGIAAHDPVEAVYLNTSVDLEGKSLSGEGNYVITFREGHFPPFDPTLHGFWSVTMYDEKYNLVPDSEHYSINSYDPKFQTRDTHGGLTIHLQRQRPDQLEKGHYWLQSPRGKFFLMLRDYIPGPEVSNTQTWVPPPVVRNR